MRREYGGAVPKAAVSVLMGGTTADLTLICDDLTGWPLGLDPFFIVINRGKPNEEKLLVENRVGNILTVWSDGMTNGRGADGTAISAHQIGEPIEHVFTATDADEANEHVNTGTGAHGYPPISDVVTLNGVQTVTNKTIDFADNTILNLPPGPVGATGPTGPAGPVGPAGADGADGAGISYQPTAPVSPVDGDVWVDSDNIVATPSYLPPGGAAGEVLAKVDATDYNVDWTTVAGGSTVDYQPSPPASPTVGALWIDSDGSVTGAGSGGVSESFHPFFLMGA